MTVPGSSPLDRRREPHRSGGFDMGSLPMAMLLVLVGISLSALIVPIAVLHAGNTRTSVASVHALHAAQAGLDVAVGQIRAAKDDTGRGSLAQLPCGPLQGSVGNGNTGTFAVTISYVQSNPLGSWTASSALSCPPMQRPSHVLLVSVGTDATASRSLRATYPMGSSNANIPGGSIRVFRTAGSPDLCLDSGPVTPPPGTAVTVKPCVDGNPRQEFGYYTDLSLVLVASTRKPTAAAPNGLCLDAGIIQVSDNPVRLQPCSATAPGHQRWSFTDYANFLGTTDTMASTELCMNVQYLSSTSGNLVMGSCAHIKDNVGVFSPDETVGAGAAGVPVATSTGTWQQLVNFRQFGRCIDIADQLLDTPYLIAWPCKQGGTVGWNQRWILPSGGTGQIRLHETLDGTTRCLRSPSGSGRSYVDITLCGATATADTTWTAVGATTNSWDTNNKIIDAQGKCLAANDQAEGDLFYSGYQISKIIVETCSPDSPNNELQHWNAPPRSTPAAPLTDIAER